MSDINKFIIPIIILLSIIFIKKYINIDTFQNKNLIRITDNYFLNKLNEYYQQKPLHEEDVKLFQIKNSSQLIIQDYTKAILLEEALFKKNFKFIQKKLRYELRVLEHTTNLNSGLLISQNYKTKSNNKKYGFLLKFNPCYQPNCEGKSICPSESNSCPQGNKFAEFTLDFTKNHQSSLDNIMNIEKTIAQPSYKNLPRKTIHIFTKSNCPPDLLPYFSEGTNGKKIEIIGRFTDATNLKYLKDFPNGKFNILDYNNNPILTACTLDKPYCNIHLKPSGNVKGRDKLVIGKINPQFKEYTILDNDKYSSFKAQRAQKNKEEQEKNLKLELKNLLKSNPKYDDLLETQKKNLELYEPVAYQKIIDTKLSELKKKDKSILTTADYSLIESQNKTEEFGLDVSSPVDGFANLFPDIQEKFQNMSSHFTNQIESFTGFQGEKYLQYQDPKRCSNQNQKDKHIEQYNKKKYSVIYPDNILLKSKEESLKKIKDLYGFKCRKHHSTTDNRYFYGGIDFDGVTRCYGSDNSCKIFETEKECLELEKILVSGKKKEGFTNIENFDSAFESNLKEFYSLKDKGVFWKDKYSDTYHWLSNFKLCEPEITETQIKENLSKNTPIDPDSKEKKINVDSKNNFTCDMLKKDGYSASNNTVDKPEINTSYHIFVKGFYKGKDIMGTNTKKLYLSVGIRAEEPFSDIYSIGLEEEKSKAGSFVIDSDNRLYMFFNKQKYHINNQNNNLIKFPDLETESENLRQWNLSSTKSGDFISYLKRNTEDKPSTPYYIEMKKSKSNNVVNLLVRSAKYDVSDEIYNFFTHASSYGTYFYLETDIIGTQKYINLQAINEIESKKTEATTALDSKQTAATTALDSKQTAATTALDSKQTAATTALDSKQTAASTLLNNKKKEITSEITEVKNEVVRLDMKQQQETINQKRKEIQIKNEEQEKERIIARKESVLESSEQQKLSEKIQSIGKLVEYDPFDSSQPGFIGSELEEDYQKYNFLNCIPHIREDVTCKHVSKNMDFDYNSKLVQLKNQTLVDIITFQLGQELGMVDVISNHKNVEFNQDLAKELQDPKRKALNNKDLEVKKTFDLGKPIDYLIEPCYDEFKNINPAVIFDNFKYKFRFINQLDEEISVIGYQEFYFTAMEIIKDNKSLGVLLDSNNKTVRLLASDNIYLYVDRKSYLNIQVFDSENNMKSKLEKFKIPGKFGDDINLYLQTNNTQIFEQIQFTEQLDNISFPYNPFIDIQDSY